MPSMLFTCLRFFTNNLSRVFIIAFVLAGTNDVRLHAQQPSSSNAREQGVALYKQEDYKGATRVLWNAVKEDAQDIEAWHYLGLALHRSGDVEKAHQTFSRAVELGSPSAGAPAKRGYVLFNLDRPDEAIRQVMGAEAGDNDAAYLITASYIKRQRHAAAAQLRSAEAELQSNSQSASTRLQKAHALLAWIAPESEIKPQMSRATFPRLDEKVLEARRVATQSRLEEAADNYEAYLRLSPQGEDSKFVHSQLEALRVSTKSANKPTEAQSVFNTSQLTSRVRITSKPEPGYTVKARRKDISGIVSMRILLAADGTVKRPLVLLSLPYGLTEKALEAVRRIKFEPAIKDGRSVSTYAFINYAFTLY